MENRYKPNSNNTNQEEDECLINILHHKCPVIQLVKKQMFLVDSQFENCIDDLKQSNTWPARLYRLRYAILSLILALILLYFAVIYGAILGAGACSKSSRGTCCTLGALPGLHYVSNHRSVF